MKLWIESSIPEHDVVSIYGDKEGLRELLSCIESLLDGPIDADCHFMTPSFGGDELTEGEGGLDHVQPVHQLNLYRVT